MNVVRAHNLTEWDERLKKNQEGNCSRVAAMRYASFPSFSVISTVVSTFAESVSPSPMMYATTDANKLALQIEKIALSIQQMTEEISKQGERLENIESKRGFPFMRP